MDFRSNLTAAWGIEFTAEGWQNSRMKNRLRISLMMLGAVIGGAAGTAFVPTTSEPSVKRQMESQIETSLKPIALIFGSSFLGATMAVLVTHFATMQVQQEVNKRRETRRKS